MCEQSLNDYITEQCALIDAALDRLLPAENESPETIHKAMRYSLFAGGKRMRPVLCLAAAEAFYPETERELGGRRTGSGRLGSRLRRGNDAYVFPHP